MTRTTTATERNAVKAFRETATKTNFQSTFETLRAVLERNSKNLIVSADKPGDFQVASATLKDRSGRPLFLGAVQIRKNYVSYHLIPVYAVPKLLKTLSPDLKKRMQGKSCFNFTTVEKTHAKELDALTKAGFEAMKSVDLPWTKG